MEKRIWVSILFLALIIGGAYFFIKFNPPLEIGTIASSGDNKSVVVGVGNKGFRDISILDVSVNNGEKPMKTKLQVSNALQGFILTNDDHEENARNFGFTDIDKVAIKTGSSPSFNLEKSDKGTATKNDEIYGVSVFNTEEVNKVLIKYRYLGILFSKTVTIN